MNNLKKWDTLHCFAILGAVLLYWKFHFRAIVVVAILISMTSLYLSERSTFRQLVPFGGYANRVTLIRLLGILLLFIFSEYLCNLYIAGIMLPLILLDVADGFLARKFHQETELGAMFDMETDAIMVCMMTIIAVEKGLLGNWMLTVGLMRYYYIAILFLMNKHLLPEKRTKLGPIVAGLLFITLLITFITPVYIYLPIVFGVSACVTVSFIWSFLSVWQGK